MFYCFTFGKTNKMAKTIINAKGSEELKEALRIVAFSSKLSKSALIISILEKNPKVAVELKKLQTKK